MPLAGIYGEVAELLGKVQGMARGIPTAMQGLRDFWNDAVVTLMCILNESDSQCGGGLIN